MTPLARPLTIPLFLVLCLMGGAPKSARAAESSDQIRATFLLLLGKYVTWPAEAFRSPTAPLVIAVVGNDALANELKAQATGQEIEGHPVEVRAAADVSAARAAHIVFLPSPEDARSIAASPPALRVLEGPKNVDDGDIAIEMKEGRVAFAVNSRDVKKRGLKLSSKLMRLASSFE